jgi:hypothetical protein
MRVRGLLVMLAVIGCGWGSVCAQAAPAGDKPLVDARGMPTASALEDSVRRAVAYLLQAQAPDGGWSTSPMGPQAAPGQVAVISDQEGGRSALVTYALLSAGEDPDSPHMQRAINFIRQHPLQATYHVAARTCVYQALPPDPWDSHTRDHGKWLALAMVPEGPNQGLFSYQSATANGRVRMHGADMSNSHYGVLGLYYAADAGLELNRIVWQRVEEGWHRAQRKDGGWGYTMNTGQSYASMTAAGVATLFCTYDYLHAVKEKDLKRKVKRPELEAGLKWLADHYAVDHNPGRDAPRAAAPGDQPVRRLGGGTYVHYMLFEYARVGEHSGLTKFGEHTWFATGASYLLETQRPEGNWYGSHGPVIDTAHGLLFLSRGRAPVSMQKLQFEGEWNNRSRDLANLNRWLRRQTLKQTNWQIVSAAATDEELREAPILYIASDEPLPLSEEQLERLKRYVEQGGMLLLAADGTSAAFANDAEEKLQKLFAPYRFRDLPESHSLYTPQRPQKDLPFPLRGISNGVRELAIIVPRGDLSWQWQSMGSSRKEKNKAFPLGLALLSYATDNLRLRLKGQGTWVDRQGEQKLDQNLSIARLRHNGNWDPEPAGWRRLANLLHNNDRLELNIREMQLGKDDLARNVKVAHLTATEALDLTEEEKQALRHFLDYDGLLLFDSAGGDADTYQSFEELLKELFPDAMLAEIPLTHPIYSAIDTGGKKLEEVTYRDYAKARVGDRRTPRLQGLMLGDRLVVIASAEDLSAGLVGQDINGIVGYSPDSATDLMRNILLWARKQ